MLFLSEGGSRVKTLCSLIGDSLVIVGVTLYLLKICVKYIVYSVERGIDEVGRLLDYIWPGRGGCDFEGMG